MSIGLYIELVPLYTKYAEKLQEKRFDFIKNPASIIPENVVKVSKIKCFKPNQQTLSKNAYLEKKWCHDYKDYGGYHATRLEWMGYREKLRSLLLPIYSMKMIIQMTKSCKDKASQREVLEVIGLIDKNDYELV